jgi:hypothetical protein
MQYYQLDKRLLQWLQLTETWTCLLILSRWPLQLLQDKRVLFKIRSDQLIDVQCCFWSSGIQLLTKHTINYQVNVAD